MAQARRVAQRAAHHGPQPSRADSRAMQPKNEDIPRLTDSYFTRTRVIAAKYGDKRVTYAVFMRRPVIFAPKLMVDWLQAIARARGVSFDIEPQYREGEWAGAGEPLIYITGPLTQLVDLETLYLQKLGATCVAAYNAYCMCRDLPKVPFLAFDARHCAGQEMADMMAYAASVGSQAAREEVGAVGFTGNANDATAHYFGNERGFGTMPHVLIGYAGSTVRAAELFHETFPDLPITVLVDYFAREISDSLAVSRRFPELAAAGKLSMRLDTHGSRYVEGLGPQESYAVLERHNPAAIRRYRSEIELKHMVGTGVSAAAIFYLREKLDEAGFDKVKIVATSGFGPVKCRIMADTGAPVDIIGTGSFLPEDWHETYATSDAITYNGVASVKIGREFLFRK
jgi:nicotinate phosphoribosyltransferase